MSETEPPPELDPLPEVEPPEHMVAYLVTDAEGCILRRGTVPASDLQHQARAGETVVLADPALPVDPASQRVDLETLGLVDWQPPAPADDDWQTWAWDSSARRWLASPTELALATMMRAERSRLLAATDWVTVRALEQGEAVPEPWASYRQALRDVPDQALFPTSVAWPTPPAG